MQLRYQAVFSSKLLRVGIKLLVVPLKLSIAAIKQLKVVFIVLLQVKKLHQQCHGHGLCYKQAVLF